MLNDVVRLSSKIKPLLPENEYFNIFLQMKTKFWKYHGNGNDFVILDDRLSNYEFDRKTIAQLCERHFGIGADGLIIVGQSSMADFKMTYYNADGKLSSLCGNGGRCVAMFAYQMKIASKEMTFEAFDGVHKATIECELLTDKSFYVSLQMEDVQSVERNKKFYFLNTGSPHYVEFVDKLAEFDVLIEGRKTRYSERFSPNGTNVNFAELKRDRLFVRTYERGVEDETLSCGTGVTAAAIAAYLETGKPDFKIQTTGGDFRVSFEEDNGVFKNICLHGPAELVFKGEIETSN